MLNLDVIKEIEQMKQKMYKYIQEYGISHVKTVRLSQKLDKMIVKTYK